MPEREPSLGEFLFQVRQSHGWSLREAAKHVGLTHSRIDEIEKMRDARTGKPFVPSYINVIRLAQGYGLRPDEILRQAGYEPGVELDPDEWELIGTYRKLDVGKRDEARRLLAQLLDGPGAGGAAT